MSVLDDLIRCHGKRGRKLCFLPLKFTMQEAVAGSLDAAIKRLDADI